LPDEFELANGLDSLNSSDADLDRDGDNLSNISEFQLNTDLDNPDTDGDGTSDGLEVNIGRNPVVNEGVIIQIINSAGD
jgi:hypothetical protein